MFILSQSSSVQNLSSLTLKTKELWRGGEKHPPPSATTRQKSPVLIGLITNLKILLAPGESTVIGTSPKGPGMDPFRPLSERVLATDGLPDREQRMQVLIYPSLNLIGNRFSSNIPLTVTNTSNHRVTIIKGIKIAFCTDDFIRHDHVSQQDILNVIDSINDPIDYMCSKERLAHLSDIEAQEVKSLLTEFKDIFSVSNDNIGRTSSHMFDINTNNLQPIVDPLRRVPLHKERIVKELLRKYENLGLIEKTDSPFRASTVLIEKKNVADSADIKDRYRLCVDYRSLNSAISDSGWPTPSVEHCFDAAAGAKYLSAIDFNRGYHQIP